MPMIRHVVMWELHDPSQSRAFGDALLRCAHLVDGMRGYEVATKTSRLPASVNVCLIATFDDAAALQRYQDHPVHQEVSRRVAPWRKLRHILDFEVAASDAAADAESALALVV
jgi:quinol monooxygenase YgiN